MCTTLLWPRLASEGGLHLIHLLYETAWTRKSIQIHSPLVWHCLKEDAEALALSGTHIPGTTVKNVDTAQASAIAGLT